MNITNCDNIYSLLSYNYQVELAPGHSDHLGRAIVTLDLGDKWDGREQRFRSVSILAQQIHNQTFIDGVYMFAYASESDLNAD